MTDASTTSPSRRPFHRRWGWILVVGLLLLAVAAQWRDVLNDRSISNIISLSACLTAALTLLVMLFGWLSTRWSKTLAGVAVACLGLLPLGLMRLRGFTGEMVPVLQYRFTSAARLQELQPATADSRADTQLASTASSQFLGPNRSAVISEREFAIPSNRSDAVEQWRIPIGEGWAGFAVQNQYCVTLEQRDAQEFVSCYRFADGKLMWLQKTSFRHENPMGGVGPRSTPTIVNDRVYTQGAGGLVQCLKLATGEPVWKRDLMDLASWNQTESEQAITWGRATSPLLIDDRLCVVPFGAKQPLKLEDSVGEGRSLIAFDALTGEVRWTAGTDQISYASPMRMTLAGQDQIVSVNESTVTGHEIDTGQVLWSIDWPGQSNGGANCSAALAVGSDAFLIAKGYGIGAAVFDVARRGEAWDVRERWASHRVLKTKFTHASVKGDLAFGLSDGTLECVDLTSGKRLWTQGRSSRYEHGHVILVEDCLVVQAEAGGVAFVAANADEFKELATLPALSSKTWNVPAVAGEFLLVRNDTEAVMYRLAKK